MSVWTGNSAIQPLRTTVSCNFPKISRLNFHQQMEQNKNKYQWIKVPLPTTSYEEYTIPHTEDISCLIIHVTLHFQYWYAAYCVRIQNITVSHADTFDFRFVICSFNSFLLALPCKMEGCPEETWGRAVKGDIIIVLCRGSEGACNNYRIQ